MAEKVVVQLEPQYVAQTETLYKDRYLHTFQEAMLNFDNIKEEVVVLTAPTGTGKSFAFPLPIVRARERSRLAMPTCLIVSPTNALIEDMWKEYQKHFPELKVAKLNRKALDDMDAHGPRRWDALLQIVDNHDVVITNPDLLNWALTGGYSYHKRQKPVVRLLSLIRYFVFDEYHLYDEEQVANILCWLMLKKYLPGHPDVKYVFASATPLPALQELLEQYGFSVMEFREQILSAPPPHGRQIHGELTVIFQEANNPNEEVLNYLVKNRRPLQRWFDNGKKVLAMFDDMVSIRQARPIVKNNFGVDVAVAEESGYFTKTGYREDTGGANLIIGTNKVEVGVNLDISVCIMPRGRHFSNFVQRFGRVARNAEKGVVVTMVNAQNLADLEKAFAGIEKTTYYDFLVRCHQANLANDKTFYTEKVAAFLGAYFFLIRFRTLQFDYSSKEVFKENFAIESFESKTRLLYHTMQRLNQAILFDMKAINDKTKGYSWQIKHIRDWWLNFLQTFRFFRGDKPSVKFVDLSFDEPNRLWDYSWEWVLKNRFVTGERMINGERVLEVSGFRDEKVELQFVIETFPFGKLNEGDRYLSQKLRWRPDLAFAERVNFQRQRWSSQGRSTDEFSRKVEDIVKDLSILQMVFSEKRLMISDITVPSNFL